MTALLPVLSSMKHIAFAFLAGLAIPIAALAYSNSSQSADAPGNYQLVPIAVQYDNKGIPEQVNVFLVNGASGEVWQWKDRGESNIRDLEIAKQIPANSVPGKLFVKTFVAR